MQNCEDVGITMSISLSICWCSYESHPLVALTLPHLAWSSRSERRRPGQRAVPTAAAGLISTNCYTFVMALPLAPRSCLPLSSSVPHTAVKARWWPWGAAAFHCIPLPRLPEYHGGTRVPREPTSIFLPPVPSGRYRTAPQCHLEAAGASRPRAFLSPCGPGGPPGRGWCLGSWFGRVPGWTILGEGRFWVYGCAPSPLATCLMSPPHRDGSTSDHHGTESSGESQESLQTSSLDQIVEPESRPLPHPRRGSCSVDKLKVALPGTEERGLPLWVLGQLASHFPKGHFSLHPAPRSRWMEGFNVSGEEMIGKCSYRFTMGRTFEI